ncbi:hypothetical protein CHLRE_07g338000v5 [Chlamydomonas reinhardtii]|uniref:DNA replication licensing factor MCM2 n=1 Tax=Chlamydomonas reinhardtii TaxID=3055 RepID=A8JCF0_CHLRE|nr:uncharacterized protein CHLRE_07g338000v5 [Chlamydomonas reinhardtii]PNW80981.1 hypothetical protein CHLRE_07g338000v5 [Chlamydomonas reinhardtii]|eukprot:XP_001700080.1 minichromosome maintenance protein 2 [Chlamydomonas reinhardtii]
MDGETNPLDQYEPVEDEVLEEEEEGEDLMENMERDYQPQPHLDNYDAEGIDDDAEEEGDVDAHAARMAAEEELNRRDAKKLRPRRGAVPDFMMEDDDQPRRDEFNRRRKRRSDAGMEEDTAVPLELDIEEAKGRLTEWIAQEQVASEIKRRFRYFLRNYPHGCGRDQAAQEARANHTGVGEDGEGIYMERIRAMAKDNKRSLELDYAHWAEFQPTLSIWLADAPKQMMEYLDEAATEVVEKVFSSEFFDAFKAYGEEYRVHVRVVGLPISDSLRDLRNYHLNCLIRVSGVVTRRTGVFPQLQLIKYDCVKCGYVLGPFAMHTDTAVKPNACPSCTSKGPFEVNSSETVYRDYQKITLQESPGSVPAGRLPRHKEVILTNDLIDCARPGEEVEVTGVYMYGYDASLNVKNSFPVFSTHIEANFVSKREDIYSVHALTDDDKARVIELSRDPRIGERIIKSMAPSIYGHENIKTALALCLMGGVEKSPSPAYRLRGDINVLLLGDPGVAKSQFLKYVEKTAPRAVYTTGKGASAVGLTAAVTRDPITKEWTLEGGALVLADKGVCLIDEFDKMNDQDRVSIHEAMEQQSISISKAGIVTQLQARCAVIAAANPVGGRYDPSKTLAENVELSDPILSRFDVLAVVRDIVDPVNDEKLAQFVVGSHIAAHPVKQARDQEAREAGTLAEAPETSNPVDPDVLPQELLRKYITYAKQHCRPQLQQADYDRILRLYAALRQEAALTHGMPVAVRHLESVVRMSEASARMHLRDYVADYDINVAIKMMVHSFISSQKFTVQQTLERKFSRYLTLPQDYHALLISLLRQALRAVQREQALAGGAGDTQLKISARLLEDKAREYDIADVSSLYGSAMFRNCGFAFDRAHNVITYTST